VEFYLADTQDVVKAFYQVPVVKGLEDIFRGAALHQFDSYLFAPLAGEHDDIGVREAGTDFAQRRQAIHFGHHVIKQDQFRQSSGYDLHAGTCRRGSDYLVTAFGEDDVGQLKNMDVIINDDNCRLMVLRGGFVHSGTHWTCMQVTIFL